MEDIAPRIDTQPNPQGRVTRVLGAWTAAQFALPQRYAAARTGLAQADVQGPWDLREVQQLDHVGAQLLWNHWGRQWPARVETLPAQRAVLERVAQFTVALPPRPAPGLQQRYLALGDMLLALGALFCTVAGYYAVLPMMEAARAGQAHVSFATLHIVSTGFFTLKGLLVLALAWRLTRPPASS